ncbi:conserved hypothetical protein [uncultured Pleomorphomonas sp.]|uniref:DAPG hydrolase PhiG domain-containing protein n=1 Tax=uncultured Pleomorphomonas sp. TaxID=442121 RepID=A0A212LML7_9HYPH|nr:hypothetical protein [uncultured Pleomorphomonas sp.]SCM78773.1 conserved hypothetical protein [uncultured Pleomorphomonas sp.]
MKFSEANDLLKPGYLSFETGVASYPDGCKTVAALTRMPHCRAKMVHWWFGWLGGDDQYKLWHPRDHVASAWKNRVNGNYIGAVHLVEEYLGRDADPVVHSLQVNFDDPHEFFDPVGYDAFDGVAICGRPGAKGVPFTIGHMCHFVRNTDYGCEMRTRFWLGDVKDAATKELVPDTVAAEVRAVAVNDAFCAHLLQHSIEEMGYLADLLPVLYRQVTEDSSF